MTSAAVIKVTISNSKNYCLKSTISYEHHKNYYLKTIKMCLNASIGDNEFSYKKSNVWKQHFINFIISFRIIID